MQACHLFYFSRYQNILIMIFWKTLSRVQSPESRVHSPESRVHSPESRVQSPESRVQGPVQSPVQVLDYAFRRHVFICRYQKMIVDKSRHNIIQLEWPGLRSRTNDIYQNTRYRFTGGYWRETRFTCNTLFTSCSECFSCSPLLCRSILIS